LIKVVEYSLVKDFFRVEQAGGGDFAVGALEEVNFGDFVAIFVKIGSPSAMRAWGLESKRRI